MSTEYLHDKEVGPMRPATPAADALIRKYFPVLDHGFVALTDYMGSDAGIESAARVSYHEASNRKVSDTRTLLRYLRRHRHTSPTEMVELKFHCCMPMFVARQWIRHRTASVNEMSGRYSLLPQIFFTPEALRAQSKSNKQGSEVEVDYAASVAEEARQQWTAGRIMAGQTYEWLTGLGVANELARIDLPLSTYTQWIWKIDLHNLLHFLSLRCDPHAQFEVRVYANLIAGIVKEVAPISFEAWYDYEFAGARFSRMEMTVLRDLLRVTDFGVETSPGHNCDESAEVGDSELQAIYEMGPREVTEFKAKLGPIHDQDFTLDMRKVREPKSFEMIAAGEKKNV